jgi:hypothetical protein
MQRLRSFPVFLLIGITLLSPANAAVSVQNSLCVIPVKNGLVTSENHFDVWRVLDRVISIPSIPYPVIYTYEHKARMMTIKHHELVALNENPKLFPSNSFWDQYWFDKKTGKVIGNGFTPDVYAFNSATQKFEKLYNALEGHQLKTKFTFRTVYIPALNTVLFPTNTGIWEVKNTQPLAFLPAALQQELGQVEDIKDIPYFKGMLLYTEHDSRRGGKEKRVYFLSYDKKLFPTKLTMTADDKKFKNRNYFSEAYATYPIRKILITGEQDTMFSKGGKAYLLSMQGDEKTGYSPGSAEEIPPLIANGGTKLSTTTDKYAVLLGGAKAYLFNKSDLPFSPSNASVQPLESRNATAVTVGNKLYMEENGKFKRPPTDLPPAPLDIYFFYDVPEIHRVLLRAGDALFELNAEYQLVPLMDGKSPEHSVNNVANMPKSRLAVIITKRALYALKDTGAPTPIRTQSRQPKMDNRTSRTSLLSSQELLISADDGIYIVVDEKISGTKHCKP